ncbi:hypothetical protein EVAR_16079_1 [Eumeta japonica]|uniref:RNase H type-1 domain-containing protein n=1 Tax=Eumeta variegata TaxID=151549 RepID=A0A4C1UII1_EUMVA|nr:hypothetical protein EVAR_16079_1 [Eumeta japonica]
MQEFIAISKALTCAEIDDGDKIFICLDSKSAIQHLARCASAYLGVPKALHVLAQLVQFKLRNVAVKLEGFLLTVEYPDTRRLIN